MAGNVKSTLDPLYQLFEHHLITRSYEDSTKFTKALAEEYLGYLDSSPAHVPFHVRTLVLEDLESEAREMLVKKMYGCVESSEYVNRGSVVKVTPKESLGLIEFDSARLSIERQAKKSG